MNKQTAVLTNFPMRTDAEIFQHYLVAAGIESEIAGEEAWSQVPYHGAGPDSTTCHGLSLYMNAEDFEDASELLATFENR